MPIIGVVGDELQQLAASQLDKLKKLVGDTIDERFHDRHRFPQRTGDGSIDLEGSKRVVVEFVEAEFRA